MQHTGKRIIISEEGKKTLIRLGLVVFFAVMIFSTVRFFVRYQRPVETRDRLKELIAEQESLSKIYEEELSRVGTPEYYEYMARKYFGYIYPDETILIVTNGDDKD